MAALVDSKPERIDVQRGTIILESYSFGRIGWVAFNTEDRFVALGSEECRAYAITEANIALIRAATERGHERLLSDLEAL